METWFQLARGASGQSVTLCLFDVRIDLAVGGGRKARLANDKPARRAPTDQDITKPEVSPNTGVEPISCLSTLPALTIGLCHKNHIARIEQFKPIRILVADNEPQGPVNRQSKTDADDLIFTKAEARRDRSYHLPLTRILHASPVEQRDQTQCQIVTDQRRRGRDLASLIGGE